MGAPSELNDVEIKFLLAIRRVNFYFNYKRLIKERNLFVQNTNICYRETCEIQSDDK